uniref:Uncharacterized protein n=1 Tax=Saccoglossus kowalevskii TaxID=10224 RepID=A0ABM0MH64_SACKO
MDKLLRRSHRKSKAKAEKAGKLPKAESDAEKKAEPPQTTPTKHKKDKRRSKQQENETKRPKIQHLGLISQSRPLEELPQQQRPKHEEQREPQAKPQEPLQQEYKHGLEQQQRPQVLQQDMNHSLQLTTTPDKKGWYGMVVSYQKRNNEYRQRKTSMDETEVRSLPGGEFARNSPYRASLPVVRPAVNMSKAKPL